jgi:hypothetical protein
MPIDALTDSGRLAYCCCSLSCSSRSCSGLWMRTVYGAYSMALLKVGSVVGRVVGATGTGGGDGVEAALNMMHLMHL